MLQTFSHKRNYTGVPQSPERGHPLFFFFSEGSDYVLSIFFDISITLKSTNMILLLFNYYIKVKILKSFALQRA